MLRQAWSLRHLLLAAFYCVASAAAYGSNPIQLENQKPGDTTWQLYNEANGEIEGYASATSVNRGESINIYVNTSSATFTLEVYRLGWYGGAGGRRVFGPVSVAGTQQVIPAPDPTTGLVECNWINPYTLTIPNDPNDPTNWCSGAYVVKLTAAGGKDKYVYFVVRDDARHANHYFQSSVTTSQAYNPWGGKSLYKQYTSDGVAARKVSFNRPYDEGAGTGDFLWRWEYSTIRFLEREGYDVQYCTDLDTHERGSLLLNHKDFLSIGHDEYWSDGMRTNVTAARDAGVNLGFFSSNTCYWQVRFEPSPITGAADRTMVGYKENALTEDPYALDKDTSNDRYITTNWRSAPVNKPESELLGEMYKYDPVNADLVISDTTTVPWIFTGTGLAPGSHLPGLLGYEVDALDSSSPAATHVVAHSPYTNTKVTPNTTQYSDMTVYTAASGAIVFAAGTMQFPWGLDDWNSSSHGSLVNPAAQQMMRNILEKFAGDSAENDCLFTITPSSTTFSATAGSATISLTTGPNCLWTLTNNTPWVSITSPVNGGGTGSATIAYNYTQNTGATRTGTIMIADKAFTITQNACSYSLSPTAATVAASGTNGTVNVTADGGCSWSATANDSWIHITGAASSSGSAPLTYTVDVNQGPARTGSMTIAGKTFTVTQASGCTYSISPTSASYSSSGGSGSLVLTTYATCSWTAVPSASWIGTSLSSGSGSVNLNYSVGSNPGGGRTGSIVIGGQTFSITQSSGCTYVIDRNAFSIPQGGGTGVVTVTTDSTCFWSSSSGVPWITITSGADSRGNGTATFTVDANNSGDRSAVIAVAGNNVTITQAGVNCSYHLSPTVVVMPPGGGSGSVQLTTASNCAWQAYGGSFTSVTSAASGTGNATITFNVAGNGGTAAREDHVTIGGQILTIDQNGGATINLNASATSSSQAQLTWSGVPNAARYDVQRSASGSFVTLGNATTTAYSDSGLLANSTYLYRVRAFDAANNVIAYSNIDPATTLTFSAPAPLSLVHASDFMQARQAVNAYRAAVGLPAFVFTDATLARGMVIKAVYLTELRRAFDEAAALLRQPTGGYTDVTVTPRATIIKAVHLAELLNRMK